MALFAADRFTGSSPWRQPADDRQRLVETGHGDHVDATVCRAVCVLEILAGRDQEGVGAGVDRADRLLVDAADLVYAAGKVELAGDRDLVSLQQVAAAERVVDLERERQPRRRPADRAGREAHRYRDVADVDGVADRNADQRAGWMVGAGDGADRDVPRLLQRQVHRLPRLDRLHGPDQVT